MTTTRTPRPKVQAAAGGSVAAAILAFVLETCGVNVNEIPAWVLALAGGALATAFAYIKRDGIDGLIDRIRHGEDGQTTLELVLIVLLVLFLAGGVVSSHLLLIVALVLLVLLVAGRGSRV